MLTDKEISDIIQPYLELCGKYWENEMKIPESVTENFTNIVKQAIIDHNNKLKKGDHK